MRRLSLSNGFINKFGKNLNVLENWLNYFYKEKLGISMLPTEFHVTLIGDCKMKTLNREYRGKNKTTDVLSFPIFENLRCAKDLPVGALELGDIFISLPVLKKQAQDFQVSEENEFIHLFVHGFLHLLGFDHEISEKEEKLMEGHEKELIQIIQQKVF